MHLHDRCAGVLAVIAGVATFWGVESSARAYDFDFELEHELIEFVIEQVAQEQLIDANDQLKWRDGKHVSVSQLAGQAIDIHINLTTPSPGPDVDVHFTIAFGCDWQSPSMQVTASEPEINASYPVWVDILTLNLSNQIAVGINILIEVKRFLPSLFEESLNEQIQRKLFEKKNSAELDTCPQIAVGSAGDVSFGFGSGSECDPGDRLPVPCGPTQRGTGSHKICVNGYWDDDPNEIRDCEQGAPPGGQLP